MRPKPYRPRILILGLLLALLGGLPASAAVLAQPGPAQLSARPATAVARYRMGGGWDARAQAKTAAGDGLISVIVKLDDAPLAAYAGGVAGLPATAPGATGARRLDTAAPASRRYLAYLDQRQREFAARARAAIPQARLAAQYRTVLGGVAMIIPASQIDHLAALPGVAWVQRDELRQADTDRSPEFIGADVIWRALAADPALGDGGEGVVVGVIDTGIWPEHPSFADDGSYPAPPPRWHGACEAPNDGSQPLACNHKLIGAREALDVYKFLIGLTPGEFDSARDNSGHGTHTASTAAGNAGVAAAIFGQPRGTISGIAPRAYVAAYKGLGNSGGFTADLVTAIDQAVADGVDIINYSIGSVAAADPYRNADALAFLDAYRAGVFVAVSAGNAGPGPGTIGAPANAPWVMSVAASTTDRRFSGQLALRAGADQLTLSGASITTGITNRPVVDAAWFGVPQCDAALPAAASGAIVICKRGGNARVDKSLVVQRSGGAGMVLYNPTPLDVLTDNHWVPSLHIDAADAAQLLAFTSAHSNTAILGDIAPGQRVIDPQLGDIMAAFSSRGPLPGSQAGVIKPDIAAPGVQILAGNTPAPALSDDGPPGQLFQAIAGTSMAAPHVAGAGALLRALHPDWTPGQIKSALMTSARSQVLKEDRQTPATAFDMGAGRIDLTRAGDPGLTLDVPADDYAGGKDRLAALNYPSIALPSFPGRQSVARSLRSVLDHDSSWALTASAPAGAAISLTPAVLNIPAHGTASFTATIDAGSLPEGSYFGSILLQSGERSVRLPLSFTRRQPSVTLEQQCVPGTIILGHDTSCRIVARNTGAADANIHVGAYTPQGLMLRQSTLVNAAYNHATRELSYTGQLPAYQPPSIAITPDPGGLPFGYVPLASLGVPPSSCDSTCDDVSISYVTPAFSYNGATYDHVTVVSNGYLIVGDHREISIFNQKFPDKNAPNNVVAPYWADLDLDGTAPNDSGGGTWYAAYVSAGAGSPTWFVAEWADAALYNRPPDQSHHSFEVWIEGGSGRIHLAYGPNSPAEDRLTVGAENIDGSSGGNYYVDTLSGDGANGKGTPPAEGDVLNVAAVPEQLSGHTISFLLRGKRLGAYEYAVELTADTFEGVNIATQPLTVVPAPR
ncbi:S8 family serine peptidase [Kouleothrix sp.]|uniref:S8 family serine peptidase n=1 Tax=Kouleothrix sp. TaxID=2779161 RepID=UPI00391DB13A